MDINQATPAARASTAISPAKNSDSASAAAAAATSSNNASAAARDNRVIAIYRLDAQDGSRKLVMRMQRGKLEKHSGSFKTFLESYPVKNESYREVTLPSGAPAALRHVLQTIKDYRGLDSFFIKLRAFSTAQSIAIWEACELLRIQPDTAQKKIAGHLAWRISHDRLTPQVMANVYKVFRPFKDHPDRTKHSPYNSMIHQHVWDIVHSSYLEEDLAVLTEVAAQWPDLTEAIEAKKKTLAPKAEQHKRFMKLNKKRDHARQSREKQEKQEARQEETREKWVGEVLVGLRPLTQDLAPYVLGRQRMAS